MAKLVRGGGGPSAANAKRSSGASTSISVPFQPSKGGARVIKSKGSSKPKTRSFKLDIKTKSK